MTVTYEVHTDQRTLNVDVGATFARNPGERILAVRRIPQGSTDSIPAAEKRWFLKTLTGHIDWTSDQ